MPKRSNDFQKIAYLASKHLGESAEVEESAMLEDVVTGQEREVDIVLSREVDGHPVVVSIECTDRKRKADLPWVEQMYAKHLSLPTNLLVLYSRGGFTGPAIKGAEVRGIRTVEMEEVEEGYLAEVMGASGNLVFALFSATIEKLRVVTSDESDTRKIVRLMPDNNINLADGEYFSSCKEFAETYLKRDDVVKDFAKQGTEEHVAFCVGITCPQTPEEQNVFLQRIDPPGTEQIIALEISGSCEFKTTVLPIENGKLGHLDISWGKGKIDGKSVLAVASEGGSGGAKMSITFER